jgi:hypothetical protein
MMEQNHTESQVVEFAFMHYRAFFKFFLKLSFVSKKFGSVLQEKLDEIPVCGISKLKVCGR